MSSFEIVTSLLRFTIPLAFILGLWWAFRWIRRLANAYPFPDPGVKSLNHALLLLAWLALGILLAGPFIEALQIVQGIAVLYFDPYYFEFQPEVTFGLDPMQFTFLIYLLQTVAVYAYVTWIGVRLYRRGKLGFLDRVADSRLERLLLLTGFAALVNRAVATVWNGVEYGLASIMERWVILRALIGWGVLAFLILNLVIILARRLVWTEADDLEEWEQSDLLE